MSTGNVIDKRIKMRASKQLLATLYEHREHITEIPENINKALKAFGYKMNVQIEIPTQELSIKLPKIDTKLLSELSDGNDAEITIPISTSITQEERKKTCQIPYGLYLSDLIWLSETLKGLRQKLGIELYLHQFLNDCELMLPENSIIERNPELEKRCKRLREEQENLEYMKMTKSVDASIKNCPEDSIAYQMKSLNRQIIAIFQFVVSVITGFVFGFIGVPLLVGNMDFGARIMLGIFCAIIIAVAEFYFLAKKLSEYDDTATTLKKHMNTTSKRNHKKPHAE